MIDSPTIMKLQLLLAAAVAIAPSVFVESREVPSLRGTIIDDAEDGDVAAVSRTFYSGSSCHLVPISPRVP